MNTFTALEGMTLYDVCLQVYGNINLLYKLMKDSGIEDVNKLNLKGVVFKYDSSLISNTFVAQRNTTPTVIYNTGLSQFKTKGDYDVLGLEGGGYITTEDGGFILI